MPVECVPSNLESDIRCAVCGQGFLLFCRRVTQQQRTEMRAAVSKALRSHHHEAACMDHAHASFMVELSGQTLMPVYA